MLLYIYYLFIILISISTLFYRVSWPPYTFSITLTGSCMFCVKLIWFTIDKNASGLPMENIVSLIRMVFSANLKWPQLSSENEGCKQLVRMRTPRVLWCKYSIPLPSLIADPTGLVVLASNEINSPVISNQWAIFQCTTG